MWKLFTTLKKILREFENFFTILKDHCIFYDFYDIFKIFFYKIQQLQKFQNISKKFYQFLKRLL